MGRSDNSLAMAPASRRATAEPLPTFARTRVAVIGDAILDGYVEGSPREVCREAPVPVIDQSGEVYMPGGAANVALNVAALGAQCMFACALGTDQDGEILRRLLEHAGVVVWPSVSCPDRVTVSKRRVVADGQTLVRVDRGEPQALDGHDRQAFLHAIQLAVGVADLVIVSDYRYGLIDDEVLDAVRVAAHATAPVAGDSREPERLAALGCDIVKPNRSEAARLLGVEPAAIDAELVESRQRDLAEATGARLVAVTMDADGSVVVGPDLPSALRFTAPKLAHAYPAGAGDSYLAAFGLTLAVTGDVAWAAEAGACAANVVIGQERTVPCDRAQLDVALGVRHGDGTDSASAKVVTEHQLAARITAARRDGQRIVFTNGCFDLLHSGHADLLSRARALGDLLVVAVNDDASVRAIKGPDRPVMTLAERAGMLAALSSVDLIVSFSELTAERLVRLVRPDVYVKGDDGDPDAIPEVAVVRELGGMVRLLPPVIELSTSTVLSRIAHSAAAVGTA